MRKILILILFICNFLCFSCAEYNDFYLNIKIPPEKIIPNTLNAELYLNESVTLWVDLMPKFADDSEIVWECVPSIADVDYSGRKCTIRAIEEGDGVLYATDQNGVSCEIKIKILPQKVKISIEGTSDSIKVGEQMIFSAHTEPKCDVLWQVDAGDTAHVSYGGNKCKIRAKSAGRITVSASAKSGERAVKTLTIEPSEGMNLSLFGFILGVASVALLSIALIFYLRMRRENEK